MDVDSAPAPEHEQHHNAAAAKTLNALADAVEGGEKTEVKKEEKSVQVKEEEKELATQLPEGDVYIALLVVLWLLDQGDYTKVRCSLSSALHRSELTRSLGSSVDQGKELCASLLETVTSLNRRTMDQLSSKIYFYWVRLHELAGDDTAPLRTTLLAAQRTAALRHDDDLQATLLPLLLRNYLEHHLYDQADKLVSKTTFPEGTAGNAQLARWYYYVGESAVARSNPTRRRSRS